VSYTGGKLAPWFDATETRKTAHRMTERGGKAVLDATVKHTPVDTDHLRQSWKRKPVVIVASLSGDVVYESGVETNVDYAPYVEHGTGLWGPKHAKYEIRPKKPGGTLHWIGKDGEDVFAKLVMHPGSPGAHMVAIAIAEVELAMHLLMAVELEMWAKFTEHQDHSVTAS
jgi:hypothetical protein